VLLIGFRTYEAIFVKRFHAIIGTAFLQCLLVWVDKMSELTLLVTFVRVILGVFINALVVINALWFQKAFFSHNYQRYEKILVIILLIWAQIVIYLITLHFFGMISLRYSILLVLLTSSVAYICVKLYNPVTSSNHHIYGTILKNWTTLEQDLLFVGIGFIVLLTTINLVAPPGNWDSLNYHIYFPATWYREGTLTMVPLPFGDTAPPYYPVNSSLLYLWLMLPFDSLAIADIGQAPFVLITALGLYAVARQGDMPVTTARWAALLTLFVPMINVTGTLWSTNDVIFVASWLISLATVLRASRTKTIRDIVLAGIAIGLTIGVKGFAIAFCSLFLPWIAVILWWQCRVSWRYAIAGITAIAIPIVLLGGFSYIRNWLVTGNPLYPYRLTIGLFSFPGVIDKKTLDSMLHPFAIYDLHLLPFEPGYFNISILLILAIPSIFRSILQKKWSLQHIFLLLLIISYIFVFMVQLPIKSPRFLAAPMLLVLLLVAHFVSVDILSSEQMKQRWLFMGACIGIIISLLTSALSMGTNLFEPSPGSLHFNLNVGKMLWDYAKQIPAWTVIQYLLGIGVFAYLGQYIYNRWLQRPRLVLILSSFSLMCALSVGLEWYDRYEFFAYNGAHYAHLGRIWRWVNEYTTGQRIAYIGTSVPLPLVGHHIKNRVMAINVGEGQLLHEVEQPIPPNQPITSLPDNRSSEPNREIWLQNLIENQIDLIVVFNDKTIIWPESEWMASDHSRFSQVYQDDAGSVWLFRRQP